MDTRNTGNGDETFQNINSQYFMYIHAETQQIKALTYQYSHFLKISGNYKNKSFLLYNNITIILTHNLK